MSFPTITNLLDDFNRSDRSPLDGNWNPNTGLDGNLSNCEILTNRAGNANCSTVWLNQTGPDCEAYFTIPVIPTVNRLRVAARLTTQTSAANGYSVDFRGAIPDLLIMRWDAGVGTAINTTTGATLTAGDAIGIACIGDRIQSWKRVSGVWSLHAEATSATYGAGGYLGFGMSTPTFVDDFSGGTAVLKQPLKTQFIYLRTDR